MNGDFTIGRVLSVDTSQVLVELDNQFASQVRTTFERAMDVGRINSYISIPVGTVTLVGMVTRASISEDLDGRSDRSQLKLPTEKRLLRAILVGTVDGTKYTQGVKLFPQVESPVSLISSEDLRIMFDADPVPTRSTFRIPIGSAALAEDITVRADPDALFGKHVAVLGSTGSGKSCTIASVLQSVIGYEGVRRTNILILDTNGEYSSAFPDALRLNGIRAAIGPLSIPYWFMNADEFVRLFAAAAGTQRPALLDALRIARGHDVPEETLADLTEFLNRSVEQIFAILESQEKISKELLKAAAALSVAWVRCRFVVVTRSSSRLPGLVAV